MKKIFLILLAFCFALCGCDSQDTQSTMPSINKTELNLTVGQSERLIVSGNDTVEWSSSDPTVARVFYGAVTALSEGATIITATADGQKFECSVVVTLAESASETQTTSSSQPQSTTSSITSQNSSQANTSPVESTTQSEETSSERTHSENVAATQQAAFALVERLTNEKYDKAIADLTKECNKIIDGFKTDLAEAQTKLEQVVEESAEGFMLKDSIKMLKESIANTEKILKNGIESLERQRTEEHQKNQEEFGVD